MHTTKNPANSIIIAPEKYKDSEKTILLKIDINQAKELQSAIEDVEDLSIEISALNNLMNDGLTNWDKMSEDKMIRIGTLGRTIERLNNDIYNNLHELPSEINSLMYQLRELPHYYKAKEKGNNNE